MTKEEILALAMEVIDANPIALVGTISLNRYPNIKALKNMKNEGLKTFYFSTRSDSAKVKQMKRRSKGSVYFYDKEKYNGVMLEGKFKVETNTSVGISELYQLDAHDPYDFCTVKFVAECVYVYTHYQTVKIEL